MTEARHLEEALEKLEHGMDIPAILRDYCPDEAAQLLPMLQAAESIRSAKATEIPSVSLLHAILEKLDSPVTSDTSERLPLWKPIAGTFRLSSSAWRLSGAAFAIILIIVLAYPGENGSDVMRRTVGTPWADETPEANDAFALIDAAFAAEDESAYLTDAALGDDVAAELDGITDNNLTDDYEDIY